MPPAVAPIAFRSARSRHITSRAVLGLALMTCWLLAPIAGTSAHGAERCVAKHSGCHHTLQAALDAAQDGDTIRLARGSFAGGVTVTKSVALVGAGRRATVLRGGGPVLTIGTFGAATSPAVSIRDMTITGGRTTSSPQSVAFVGEDNVVALGGGIAIPPTQDFGVGATVTITNTAITDNRVAPTATAPAGPPCPGGPCPFALAAGGGIDNWGTLTLENTTVSGNRVGSASGLSELASDAESGAIQHWQGRLTINSSRISGNDATATAPNGRYADSGAIFARGGDVTMTHSVVSNNTAGLAGALPSSVDTGSLGGGIHLSDQVTSARFANTSIVANTARMTNSVGDANATSGGLHVDLGIDFEMRDSVIAANRVISTTLPGSPGNAAGDSGAGELHGTLLRTRLVRNTVDVHSVAGDATALAGAAIVFGTLSAGTVAHNQARAVSPRGNASAEGGGLITDEGGLTLRDVPVRGNDAAAIGHSGSARGGGIFNAPIPNGPPGGPLVLHSSPITANTIAGNASILKTGGGLYIREHPLTLSDSAITRNHPDQCSGCP